MNPIDKPTRPPFAGCACLLLLPIVAGCSSLQGRLVPHGTPCAAEAATGIRYHLAKPAFAIERKTLHKGKRARQVNSIVMTAVPDRARQFEVGLDPGWFTSDAFEIQLAEDGTLRALTSTTEDITGKVVASLIEVGAAVLGVAAAAGGGLEGDLKACFSAAASDGVIPVSTRDQVHAAVDAIGFSHTIDVTKVADISTFRSVAGAVLRHLKSKAPTLKSAFPSVREALAQLDGQLDTPPARLTRATTDYRTESELVKDQMLRLELMERALGMLPKAATVAMTIAKLHKTVMTELAKQVADPNAATNLTAALDNYRKAVEIVLKADPHGRMLQQRRQLLVTFLAKKVPAATVQQDSTAYVQLAKELREVNTAILAATGGSNTTSPSSPSVLALADEVTSRIDDRTRTDRFSNRPTDAAVRRMLLTIARARVRFGGYEASILIFPEGN